MKIIFLSDIHNDTNTLEILFNKEKDSIFYCLGDSELSLEQLNDYNIISVRGNCDNINLPLNKIIEIDNKKILLLHGHTQDVKYGLLKLSYYTKSLNCDIVIFGHTHQELMLKEDILFLNPGSLRDGQTYIKYENKEFKLKRL